MAGHGWLLPVLLFAVSGLEVSSQPTSCNVTSGRYCALRYAIVDVSYSQPRLLTAPQNNSNQWQDFDGIMGKTFVALQQMIGFEPEYVEFLALNDLNLTAGVGEFTNCIEAIAQGAVDACIADVWDTKERRDINTTVDFTVPLWFDKLQIQTTTSFEISDDWAAVFEPFSFEVWLLISASAIWLGFVLTWPTRSFEQPVNLNSRPKHCCQTECVSHPWPLCAVRGMQLLVKDNLDLSTRHNQSRLQLIWTAKLFMLITVSLFGAQLTANLTRETPQYLADSLQDASDKGFQVCAFRAMKGILEHSVDDHEGLFKFENELDRLVQGSCDIIVLSSEYLRDIQSTRRKWCDFSSTGPIISNVPVSIPCSASWQQVLSHGILRLQHNQSALPLWIETLRGSTNVKCGYTAVQAGRSQIDWAHLEKFSYTVLIAAVAIFVLSKLLYLCLHDGKWNLFWIDTERERDKNALRGLSPRDDSDNLRTFLRKLGDKLQSEDVSRPPKVEPIEPMILRFITSLRMNYSGAMINLQSLDVDDLEVMKIDNFMLRRLILQVISEMKDNTWVRFPARKGRDNAVDVDPDWT